MTSRENANSEVGTAARKAWRTPDVIVAEAEWTAKPASPIEGTLSLAPVGAAS